MMTPLMTPEQLRSQDVQERTASNNSVGNMVGIPAGGVAFPGSNPEAPKLSSNPLVQSFGMNKNVKKEDNGPKTKFNSVKDFIKHVGDSVLHYAGGHDDIPGLNLQKANAAESTSTPTPQPVDTNNVDKFYNALASHESRGIIGSPTAVVNKDTGATGAVQITKPMFDQWKQSYATDKNFANKVDWNDFSNNPKLQKIVADESIQGILSKPPQQDWTTSTPQLKAYKDEVLKNFNDPISRLAGEWVAGPNWVAKLDNPTAAGAKETVRDYINRVKSIYNSGI